MLDTFMKLTLLKHSQRLAKQRTRPKSDTVFGSQQQWLISKVLPMARVLFTACVVQSLVAIIKTSKCEPLIKSEPETRHYLDIQTLDHLYQYLSKKIEQSGFTHFVASIPNVTILETLSQPISSQALVQLTKQLCLPFLRQVALFLHICLDYNSSELSSTSEDTSEDEFDELISLLRLPNLENLFEAPDHGPEREFLLSRISKWWDHLSVYHRQQARVC